MTEAKSITKSTKPPRFSDTAKLPFDEVVVEIGPNKEKYHIHKSFLTHYSEYFRKALNGPWREGKEGVVPLNDVEAAVFNLFIEWLYSQKLPKLTASLEWRKLSKMEGFVDLKFLIIKLYVFADRFLVPSLRALLSKTIACCDSDWPWIFDVEEIAYAFQNLPSTDPILDFLVDAYFTAFTFNYDCDDMESYRSLPPEFLFRFMIKVAKYRDRYEDTHEEKKFQMNPCSYHIHGSASEKKKCMDKFVRNEQKVLVEREVEITKIPEGSDT